jgi:beta-glucosidase
VVGGYANRGVLSGAGSAQVLGVGGPAVSLPANAENEASQFGRVIYQAGAPSMALKQRAPGPVTVTYDGGEYPAGAAAAARRADVAIVFATRWEAEGADVPDLSLPNGQDAVIAAVAAANPNTIVVLETGGPVAMPWLDKVGAVIEAWYPGQKGAEVIADVMWGKINPSGRLPITFPASLSQLPRPSIPGADLPERSAVDAPHPEGSDVGYRWFARQNHKPLFPFGYGLGYSRFAYAGLKVAGGTTLTISFDVTNTGAREGMDTPQAYLTARPGGPTLRLVGFQKVALKPGETRHVTVQADRRLLADYDLAHHGWSVAGGAYAVAVGASSADLTLTGGAKVIAQRLKP